MLLKVPFIIFCKNYYSKYIDYYKLDLLSTILWISLGNSKSNCMVILEHLLYILKHILSYFEVNLISIDFKLHMIKP